MIEILQDTFFDAVKLIPFLFVTYLLMELLEHKTSEKSKEKMKKAGRIGPIIGSLLGVFPQCGFSVSATNLYVGRVISIGTLISVYLSTSDEMLPILISESVPIALIIKILATKIVIGMIFGFIVDLIFFKHTDLEIHNMCEDEHCDCEHGIVKSAIKHTISITIFILIITFIINCAIELIGEENITNVIKNTIIFGPIVAGLIGLIPNCASSVILTELYLSNIIDLSCAISGLLVNAGVGLLVLFKTNKNIKENVKIVSILYLSGVISGILLHFIL